MKLLIADDRQDKIDLIRAILTHFKWRAEPLIAQTTEGAMRLIDEHDITHAFVDFYIPSENGPAIIAYLKTKNPDAHIALVSSSDKKENCDAAKAAGAEACICTSYHADEVEMAFNDILHEWML
jgi:DNA-binding NarL/FixJ family response regulator